LKNQLLESDFTEQAFLLSESVFQRVALWKDAPVPLWPTDEASAWILRRIARHGPDQCLALGIVDPARGKEEALVESLASPGVHLVSWAALGAELQKTLPAEILEVSLWLLGGILVILFIALRDWRAIALFLLTTFLVLACLAGVMSWLDMKWGFFNLAAVLLLLGTGTDYSILILLSFKRFHNAEAAQRQLSTVIFLCCSSSMAGFATLGLASNMGLSALGRTCALGLLIDGLISLFILPHLCQIFLPKKPPREGNLGS
jgi:predicted RND superfamily exporter protein